uniref:Uncharacterized protein n=1 Tax=Parascaris equorum TaxID=6256 RepID=A0A914R3N4_PAREQ
MKEVNEVEFIEDRDDTEQRKDNISDARGDEGCVRKRRRRPRCSLGASRFKDGI